MATPHAYDVVLVHGALVDGSGWEGVYQLLRRDGFTVSVVQNSTYSLETDVAMTKQILDLHERPVILVGHSYGGAVITEAGNDARVRGLVYVAAFAPDADQSVEILLKGFPPWKHTPPIAPLPSGLYLMLEKAKFRDAFAADLDYDKAAFMADAQVPWGVAALRGTISEAAWHRKPSWYLVSTEDHMIPPPAQRAMAKRAGSTVVEASGSHAIYMSRPDVVAQLIETAAESESLAA